MNKVIINADDFGMNSRCTGAIAEAFSKGLVTDTTIMATGEYFDEALELARSRGFFDKIGIHLNLTEGKPLTEGIKKLERFVTNGRFNKRCDSSTPLSKAEQEAIYAELSAQVEKLEKAGVKITHADSHHHIHTWKHIAPAAIRVCREHGILKMRIKRNSAGFSAENSAENSNFRNMLIDNGFRTADYFVYMIDILEACVPGNTEILVHPDFDKDGVLIDRRSANNGIPSGYRLPDIAGRKNLQLTDYLHL